MVLAVGLFACLDTMSKYLAAHYPVPAIVWARNTLQLALMLVFVAPRMGTALVRTANLRLQIVRGIMLIAASLSFMTALSRLPLAECTSMAFTAPLIIAVLAGPLLKEEVQARTWVALAAGFVGVMLIIRPGSALFSWAALLPLGSAVLMATYQMMTRRLAGRDAPLTTLFYPALIGTLLVPVLFPMSFVLPRDPLHIALFVAIGVVGSVGHFFLIRAFDHAPASMLGPFTYAQLVVALLLGWAVFGQLPDGYSLLGMLVIVASGLALALKHR